MDIVATTFDRIEVGKPFLWQKDESNKLILMEKKDDETATVYGHARKRYYNQIHFYVTKYDVKFKPNQSVVGLEA